MQLEDSPCNEIRGSSETHTPHCVAAADGGRTTELEGAHAYTQGFGAESIQNPAENNQ